MQITNHACDFNSCFIAWKPQLGARHLAAKAGGWAGMEDPEGRARTPKTDLRPPAEGIERNFTAFAQGQLGGHSMFQWKELGFLYGAWTVEEVWSSALPSWTSLTGWLFLARSHPSF